jgi:hypothetical protein
MGVEGSDVDGVPKEVGGVGRPRSGPIRIIAPRRNGSDLSVTNRFLRVMKDIYCKCRTLTTSRNQIFPRPNSLPVASLDLTYGSDLVPHLHTVSAGSSEPCHLLRIA